MGSGWRGRGEGQGSGCEGWTSGQVLCSMAAVWTVWGGRMSRVREKVGGKRLHQGTVGRGCGLPHLSHLQDEPSSCPARPSAPFKHSSTPHAPSWPPAAAHAAAPCPRPPTPCSRTLSTQAPKPLHHLPLFDLLTCCPICSVSSTIFSARPSACSCSCICFLPSLTSSCMVIPEGTGSEKSVGAGRGGVTQRVCG